MTGSNSERDQETSCPDLLCPAFWLTPLVTTLLLVVLAIGFGGATAWMEAAYNAVAYEGHPFLKGALGTGIFFGMILWIGSIAGVFGAWFVAISRWVKKKTAP